MKLSKSKLALAKVINENGGWADNSAYAANDEGGIICGYSSKPIRRKIASYSCSGSARNTWIRGIKTPQWHQCVLSREEYYQAYPKADADGWIEWKGGDTPVNHHVLVDVKYLNGTHEFGFKAGGYDWDWGSGGGLTIVAYRLHKPDVKTEFCESQENRAKLAKIYAPSIEQLAQDYRNANDYAERLQKEAGEAAVKAEFFAVEIRKKILELKELIGISKTEQETGLVITKRCQLKLGDVIWIGNSGRPENDAAMPEGEYEVVKVGTIGVLNNGETFHPDFSERDWRFIRRP